MASGQLLVVREIFLDIVARSVVELDLDLQLRRCRRNEDNILEVVQAGRAIVILDRILYGRDAGEAAGVAAQGSARMSSPAPPENTVMSRRLDRAAVAQHKLVVAAGLRIERNHRHIAELPDAERPERASPRASARRHEPSDRGTGA